MEHISRDAIALIVFDFDGVMTDNRVIMDEQGKESVFVSRADGQGVAILRQKDIPMIILSSEKNPVVSKRAEKLSLPVIQSADQKAEVLSEYCTQNNIPLEKVLYVGNDINDLEAMKLCGKTAVPADAHKSVADIADIVLKTKGGYGVARELADLII
ncbi:MAG: HAD hydrolase family protein [Lachnospiraceae bacterium]|jgi:YrbI family 3-deoxy-D-manno-octulosonate 8-phosphate phosphatase|nr:HAD hydrolase family protein [Lachnospiraceae bacterium]